MQVWFVNAHTIAGYSIFMNREGKGPGRIFEWLNNTKLVTVMIFLIKEFERKHGYVQENSTN